jgi:hypothetical protein
VGAGVSCNFAASQDDLALDSGEQLFSSPPAWG